MNEVKTPTKSATVLPEQARAEARKQVETSKYITARIKAAKAKRQANRPKPRVATPEE